METATNDLLKFRVWDVTHKTMHDVARIGYGDDGQGLTVVIDSAPYDQSAPVLVEGENGRLMQCTGLRDANGCLIYEGDVVDAWSEGYHAVGVITRNTNGFLIQIPPPVGHWHLTGPEVDPCRVIGNIYETPDAAPWHEATT